ncbi:MAG: hypothetical protein EBX40_08330 [Gammaproteobacteria bacterium]|nr:hypothetical protein [Gammaproteobacteria bacterium]
MPKDKVYTQDMGPPPKEPDDASAGRKLSPKEPGMPEQLGQDIRVDGKPVKPVKPVKKMAKGGSASSRADGCAQRGKTKGTMVMCGGGMAK